MSTIEVPEGLLSLVKEALLGREEQGERMSYAHDADQGEMDDLYEFAKGVLLSRASERYGYRFSRGPNPLWSGKYYKNDYHFSTDPVRVQFKKVLMDVTLEENETRLWSSEAKTPIERLKIDSIGIIVDGIGNKRLRLANIFRGGVENVFGKSATRAQFIAIEEAVEYISDHLPEKREIKFREV